MLKKLTRNKMAEKEDKKLKHLKKIDKYFSKELAKKMGYKTGHKYGGTYDMRKQLQESVTEDEPRYYKKIFHDEKRKLFFK